jgi:hypothetical protein
MWLLLHFSKTKTSHTKKDQPQHHCCGMAFTLLQKIRTSMQTKAVSGLVTAIKLPRSIRAG